MEKVLNSSQAFTISTILILIVISATPLISQSPETWKVYVWDFMTRERERNAITANFTEEFEEALIQAKKCKVFDRRNYDRLLSQKDAEKAILNIQGISAISLDSLKAHQANVVVFGEVDDDLESGQVKITIIFQTFDSKILCKESIHLLRGKRLDPESRETAMKSLVKKLFDRKTPPIFKPDSIHKLKSIKNFGIIYLARQPPRSDRGIKRGIEFIFQYFPEKFKRFSFGIDYGLFSQSSSISYATLLGLPEITLDNFNCPSEATDSFYDYLGVSTRYFPFRYDKDFVPFLGLMLAFPFNAQLVLGLQFTNLGPVVLWFEFRRMYYKYNFCDIKFNTYGNAFENQRTEYIQNNSFCILIGFNF